MSQEPKKRHSRARQGKRRASISLGVIKSILCPNCGERQLPHTVCLHCGFYKGKQVTKTAKSSQSPKASA